MVDAVANLKNLNLYQFDVKEQKVLAEYIWIDGSGLNLRSKTKVYLKPVKTVADLEEWTFDGSSTEQATTQDSEIYLKPVFLCRDPFRGDPHVLVLCETYKSDQVTPARYNFRYLAKKTMTEAQDQKPWFGVEQEYFLMKRTGTQSLWPLGWPEGGYPKSQGQYYCGVGDENIFGRAVAEAHLRLCLNAGLKIAGINAEVAPGQWEYQIGVTEGIECGDHLWISRYILGRVAEEFGVSINYDPKPVSGDWNGSGAHTNYSTEETRSKGGYDLIVSKYLPALEKTHSQLLEVYGTGNRSRLTGRHETCSYDTFAWGDGNRGRSIRVPVVTKAHNMGYFEDRRPAANMDPYLVSGALVGVTLLGGKYVEEFIQKFKDAQEGNGHTH